MISIVLSDIWYFGSFKNKINVLKNRNEIDKEDIILLWYFLRFCTENKLHFTSFLIHNMIVNSFVLRWISLSRKCMITTTVSFQQCLENILYTKIS